MQTLLLVLFHASHSPDQDFLPEPAPSAIVQTIEFNQKDYDILCERYLSQQTKRKMHVLPSGMAIRREQKGRYIDLDLPNNASLLSKINALLESKNHKEVYKILCKIRDWEINPQNTEIFEDEDISREVQNLHYVDLTKDCIDLTQDNNCIDLTGDGTKKCAYDSSVKEEYIEPKHDVNN